MYILQVVPITQSITSETLSYFSARKVQPGMLVSVPLRKKEIKALVISSEEVTNLKIQIKDAQFQLRNIINIYTGEIFSPALLRTIDKLKSFYITSSGRLLDIIIPKIILKNPEQFLRPHLYKSNNKTSHKAQTKLLQQSFEDRVVFYRTLIREKFLLKESLHIICPTQESATRLFSKLLKNNPLGLFLLHSGIPKKQNLASLTKLYQETNPSCIISTPGFLDTYQHNLTTYVIEEASSEYYINVTHPHIDYLKVLQDYTEQQGYNTIWSDSILSPEIYIWYQEKNADLIEPFIKNIFEKESMCVVNQHQLNPEFKTDTERIQEIERAQTTNYFHPDIEKIIRKNIQDNKKIFIFVPRKSLAPTILCNDCGNIARSPQSGFPYSLFIKNKERIFVCQRTGETIPAFDMCQFCNSWKLISYGIGTESIQNYIREQFPNTLSYIIDGTHAKTKKYIREVQSQFLKSNTGIVVIATQKGIPLFEHHDLSIIMGLDTFFSRMNYAIAPLLAKRIADIKEKSTSTIIQTRNITKDTFSLLGHGMYPLFIKEELEQRKKYNFPPYTTLIKITHYVQRKYARQEYSSIAKYYQKFNPEILAQPGTKNHIVFIVLITKPLSEWNIKYQDPELKERLYALDRSTHITVNPTDLY